MTDFCDLIQIEQHGSGLCYPANVLSPFAVSGVEANAASEAVIFAVIGLSLNESAVAVLNLATRLMELPIGVFTMAVSTVVFPLISRYAAQGDWRNLTTAYRQGMRLILVVNIPAAVGLTVLAEDNSSMTSIATSVALDLAWMVVRPARRK
jgi:Na+-driven multidrug efflux pump